MIFSLDLLADDPLAFFILFGAIGTALLVGISFHEFSHAAAADALGDHLPRRMGRLTLNPLAHLDPGGTVLMFLVGFGWGKPVPVNPNATANPKAALAITASAGPISNFLIAAVAGLPIRLGAVDWFSPFYVYNTAQWGAGEYVGYYLSTLVLVSLILGVFNLIPIAPLDGFKVAVGILPRDLSRSFARLEQYGPLILIALIVLPLVTGGHVGILFEIMQPVIEFFARLFAGVSGNVY